VRIIPFLVGILVAIECSAARGPWICSPRRCGRCWPRHDSARDFPLVILRTLSGSGSLALTTDIVKQFGPDSLIGRTAATIYGGSETTFYVLAVYFGAVGVKRTRHAIPSALVGDLVAASWLSQSARGCSPNAPAVRASRTLLKGRACRPRLSAIDRVAGRFTDRRTDFPASLGSIERIDPSQIGRREQSDDIEQRASDGAGNLVASHSSRSLTHQLDALFARNHLLRR